MDPTTSPADGPGPDAEARLVSVTGNGGATHYLYEFPRRPPRVHVEHDRQKRVFRIARPDGTTVVSGDEPVRYLVVVRNLETGEVSRMMRCGEPEYLYVCREENERG
jgi:hypothetical protein